ncbi:bifunctional metallophosphatase/5'-nucleotidase [Alkalibacterium sp. f15]|uniref:bifunctional metallophosphatase/5'-nucleotidase n=1 Tax=Alkalibacterium sp. f15 TaxID=3414029 RepID=UPI003BF8386E
MANNGRNWVLSLFSSTLIFATPMMVSAEEEVEEVEAVVVENSSDNYSLSLFHTNDLHASINNFGKMAYFLTEQRSQLENSLYLDAGDIFSGNPVVDLQDGEPMINLLNNMDLDLMTVGNHEFDYGQEVFQYRRNESNFNWITANTRISDSSIPIEEFDPYQIFDFGDFTVGVLGLTQNPPATNPSGIVGLEFDDYVETALKYEYLKDEVDVFIALNHIGFAADQRLAEEIDFFDVIIGGHSHTSLTEPVVVNGTPIAHSGSNARNIGVLDLVIDAETKDVTVNGRLQSVADLDDGLVDETVQSLVNSYNESTDELLSEVIGFTETGLNRDARWEMDVSLGNMITDSLRTFANTDIAITNNGGIRANIASGDITARDIFTVDPFGNSIAILEMTGHDLKDVIAYSYQRSLDSYGAQIDLQTSGLNYIIYVDEEGMYVDSDLFINEEPMDLDQKFSIATNNFIVAGGDGYDFSKATIIQGDAGQVTNALIQFVQETTDALGAVNYEPTEGRVLTLPYEPEAAEPVLPGDEDETDDDEIVDEDKDSDIEDDTDLDDKDIEDDGDLEDDTDLDDKDIEDDGDLEEDTDLDDKDVKGDESEITLPVGYDEQESDETEKDTDTETLAEEEEVVVAAEKSEGERLPATATATWAIGLVGFGSVAAGASAHLFKKRRD